MADILLTIHCATSDTEVLTDAIRSASSAPLHVRAETVHGRNFADARTSEQVTATLKRSAIECVEEASGVEAILRAVGLSNRQFPVRWHQTPILARGRLE
jgi:hypothetical protein